MKKFKLFAGAAAALAMGILPSCSSDDPITPQNPDVVEIDKTQYMAVTISSPRDKSRSYEDGSTNESAVKSFDFIFYDINGKVTAKMQSYSGNRLNDFESKPETGDPNVTDRWTSIIPVELVQGQNVPSYVVCLVNMKPSDATSISTKTLKELRDVEVEYFSDGDHFAMSNSTYFGLDIMTGEPTARLCGTPILASQLYATKEAAQKAMLENNDDGSKYVNIYVERLAAKVGLNMASTAPKDYTFVNRPTETVTIKFVPEYWFLNAIANTNYVTKRYGLPINTQSVEINYNPTYSDINDKFLQTGMTNWNSTTDHRSFWGCSPSYYHNKFPLVSDQIDDLEEPTTPPVTIPYNQKYYSYNEIRNLATAKINAKAIAYNGGFSASIGTTESTGFIYTRETTTAITTINDEDTNPAATVGSAVIVGHYTVNGEQKTFYVDRNAGAGEKGKYYGTMDAARSELVGRQNILYTSNPTTNTSAQKPAASVFALQHPSASVRKLLANPNIAGRLVTLQLQSVPAQNLYWYNGAEYVVVNENNIDQVNAQLVSTGYMDMFYNGLAFFSVPIRHLGFPESGTYTKQGKEYTLYKNGTYYWANMRLGDLGIVRNHVYTLNVNSISGLGTGLRDDDQPILPPKDAVNQWVAVRLNILSWNVANNWSVDL